MIPENINPGTPNQKDGDKLRDAFVKVNTIFTDIYTKLFTNTSDLTNDGADGINPFISLQEIPESGELQRVESGGNFGYILRNANRTNFGTTGSDSIDFSQYFSRSGVLGTVGVDNIAFGYDHVIPGAAGIVFGYANTVAGYGGLTNGEGNIFNTNSVLCTSIGYQNTIGGYTNSIFGTQNSNTSTGYSIVAGRNNVNTGAYNATFGVGLINRGYGTVIGISNLEKSQTNYTNLTNPLLIIGNGNVTSDSTQTPTSRSDAMVVLKSGLVTAPSLTAALINTNVRSLVTKEYTDVIEAKVDTNTAKHIEGTPDNITFNTAATPVANTEEF